MTQPKVRRYLDVSGKPRRLEFVEAVDGFIPWLKELPPSTASLWRTEYGDIVQIPDSMWINHPGIWEAPIQLDDDEKEISHGL